MACPLGVELDRERLYLLASEGMSSFGDRHAFACAGIEDAHRPVAGHQCVEGSFERGFIRGRSEEHTSELQVTNAHLVCRLLLEKKKNNDLLVLHVLSQNDMQTIKTNKHHCNKAHSK